MHKGSCLCGAISFEVQGELTPADACHCSQCRKTSGHYWASTDVPRENVSITGEDRIAWYRSSEKVRRGFCPTCGSSLFWDVDGRDRLAIAMGAFDAPIWKSISSLATRAIIMRSPTACRGEGGRRRRYYEPDDERRMRLREGALRSGG